MRSHSKSATTVVAYLGGTRTIFGCLCATGESNCGLGRWHTNTRTQPALARECPDAEPPWQALHPGSSKPSFQFLRPVSCMSHLKPYILAIPYLPCKPYIMNVSYLPLRSHTLDDLYLPFKSYILGVNTFLSSLTPLDAPYHPFMSYILDGSIPSFQVSHPGNPYLPVTSGRTSRAPGR